MTDDDKQFVEDCERERFRSTPWHDIPHLCRIIRELEVENALTRGIAHDAIKERDELQAEIYANWGNPSCT